uniref:Uncharacterized protein n=1 Tax=Anguilla anguilla TaxID=7936 RepID=A0A0E9U2N1_ANGAN
MLPGPNTKHGLNTTPRPRPEHHAPPGPKGGHRRPQTVCTSLQRYFTETQTSPTFL